jgi:hypothetical protein
LPGTATVADISLRIVAHDMRCQAAPVRIAHLHPFWTCSARSRGSASLPAENSSRSLGIDLL